MFIYLLAHIPNVTIANNTAFMTISPHGIRMTTLTAINLNNGHTCCLATSSTGTVQTTSNSANVISANGDVIISGVVPLII